MQHHNANGLRSIFEDMGEYIVGDVTLDYMHLVCIEVYKKMLLERLSGKFDSVRLSPTSI